LNEETQERKKAEEEADKKKAELKTTAEKLKKLKEKTQEALLDYQREKTQLKEVHLNVWAECFEFDFHPHSLLTE